MTITLDQFKKFADDNDILWFYNKPVWKTVRGRRIFPKIDPKNLKPHDGPQSEFLNGLIANKDMIIANLVQRQINLNNKQKREETMKSNIGIARVCHEVNRQYCIDNDLLVQSKWDELPSMQQSSIIIGVAHVLANPKVTATQMHEKWCDYKASEGWKLGELDAKKKLHPNMLNFNKLPQVERHKDMLFIKTVRAELKK